MKSGSVCAVLLLGFIWAFAPAARGFNAPDHQHPPDFDARRAAALQPPALAGERAAAVARLKQRLPGVNINLDEVLQTPRFITAHDGFLSGPDGEGRAVSPVAARAFPANDPHRAIKAFLNDHAALFGHGAEALDSAQKTRDYVSAHNGLRTVVWEQRLEEISVFEAVIMGHVSKNGELVNLSSFFVPNLSQAAGAGTPGRAALQKTPALSSSQALLRALESLDKHVEDNEVTTLDAPVGAEQRQNLKNSLLHKAAELRLVWLPMNRVALRLCWEVLLTEPVHSETFRVLVDARTGQLLLRRCLTVYISDATYRVYTSDSPSPHSPGDYTPTTNQPPLVSRVLVVTNAVNTNASPNGWIDDGFNETRGNNVDAHLDRDADDRSDLPRPQGSPFRVFDFPLDLTQDPATYSSAAVVQLFYWCNWMHDKLWELGFDEAAGNFQNNNFGRGGSGNDAVQADAQDGSGVNNANFTYAPDGSPPRIQMYIFNDPAPNRDGDFDAEVVLHECSHGLSERLVGGGIGISLLQPSGMGEGWSDWYALTLLSEAGDDVNGNYAMGAYVAYRFSGLMQNFYSGIRRYPYSTDLTKNPLTFKDIDPTQRSLHPGVLISPAFGNGPADEVHRQGEVWCVTLWEARAMLIGKHGFAIGNRLALQLVTDGMKLSPGNPTFIEARDAILQADQVLTGGANRNELWAAFAKRGMGFSASAPASSTTTGVGESFDLPDDLKVSPGATFFSAGKLGGPFSPASINYTLTNLGSNTVPWSSRCGNLVTLSTASGSIAPGDPSTTVIVSLSAAARNLPAGVYGDKITFSNQLSRFVQTRPVKFVVGQPDYFTEIFDQGDNDLHFQSLTFTPDGSAGFYAACQVSAPNFPTDPSGGTTLTLGDDSFAQIGLSGGAQVWLYGVGYGSFFLSANGFVTFTQGDQSYAESTMSHFSLPRISGLFRDLNPSVGGTVSWKQLADRVAVTWQDVPEYATANANSFQIEMFFDGSIRLTHLAIASKYGLAGLSAGTGEPAGFTESDLSGYGPCLPALSLTVPKNVNEANSLLASQGSVGIPQPLGSNLLVVLDSSDPSQIAVTPSVVILAGQTNAAFDLTVFDNALLDGSRIIRISAAAAGYRKVSEALFLHDNETALLSVVLPASAGEGDGLLAGAGRLALSAPPDRSVVVYFTSSDTNAIIAPSPVIIPAGQTSTAFDVMVVDDNRLDGTQTPSLTAHVENWIDGSATMTIFDRQTPPHVGLSLTSSNLMLSWPADFPGFLIQSTTNLNPPIAWSAVTNEVETVNGQYRITLEPSAGQRFFRLNRP